MSSCHSWCEVAKMLLCFSYWQCSCKEAALKGWHVPGGQYFDSPHACSIDSSYVAVLISTLLSKLCALFLHVNGCPLEMGRSTGFLLVLFCIELFKGTWPSYFPDWKSFFSQVCYLLKKNKVASKG